MKINTKLMMIKTNGCGDDGGNKQEDGHDDYGDGVI